MVLAITTKENIKAVLGWTDSARDAFIDRLIAQVSKIAENELGRTIGKGRIVETRSVRPFVQLLSLRAWPIDTITQIVWSEGDDFAGNDVVVATDYVLRKNLGQIFWKVGSLPYRSGGYVQVTYNGGMVADQATFQSTYPDIEMAACSEVINRINRKETPDGSSKVLDTGVMHDNQLTDLSDFKRALGYHKKLRVP